MALEGYELALRDSPENSCSNSTHAHLLIGIRALVVLYRLLPLLIVLGVAGIFLAGRSGPGHDGPIVIGYQTVIDPSKIPQADGLYEKAMGRPIEWRRFESGTDVMAALASGSVQIADLGSSPLAAATTRELPIETVLILAEIGNSEALVTRDGSNIRSPQDLSGKKVAVPFMSTAHYSLLSALRHWNVDASKIQILNLRPPEINAAWRRGDIDAAYVWDPVLGKLKASGRVLTTSEEVSRWGAPTFEAWVVRKDFAQRYPKAVTAFVRVTLDAHDAYRANGATWGSQSPQVAKIARLTGADPQDIPGLLAGSNFPTATEQLSSRLLGGGTAHALKDTATFLRQQRRLDRTLPSYTAYVSDRFIPRDSHNHEGKE